MSFPAHDINAALDRLSRHAFYKDRLPAAVADAALRRSGYLVGGAFGAADLLLVTCLDWARAYGIALTPGLDEYRLGIHERPAYRAAARLNFSISAGA